MALPTLATWRTTGESLHRAAQILGTIRAKSIKPLPNYLHLSTNIRPDGLSTGTMPVGELRLDFNKAEIVYVPIYGDRIAVSLAGHTQASLTERILGLLADHGHTMHIEEQEAAHVATLRDTTPLEVDRYIGEDYAQVLFRIFTATTRFRGRLLALMTPVVVWPEHFDLSFLLFTTDKDDESHPHINFGFAPYSEGFERPYLYSYAYPLREDYSIPKLPSPAYWNTTPWTGVVVPYDDFSQEDDPETFIDEMFVQIRQALLPLIA